MINKIGLGGGCHWCTEAVFQSLADVTMVEQGFIASTNEHKPFSEAVIVHFNPNKINLKALIRIHLHSHQSTSDHSFRKKYRSAIYFYDEAQKSECELILSSLQSDFEQELITQIIPFGSFKASDEMFQDYYKKRPDAPFCKRYITPKLSRLNELSLTTVK